MAIKCSKGAVQVTKVMVGLGYWNLDTSEACCQGQELARCHMPLIQTLENLKGSFCGYLSYGVKPVSKIQRLGVWFRATPSP